MTADLPKSSAEPASFRLGEHEVLPGSNELRGPHGTQRVRPLLMQVLLRLAREPGAVVRRETLLAEVWPRRMVNDEVLSRAIAELRTALGDDAREARYIQTLPKAGYRLVAPVTPAPEALAASPSPQLPGQPPVVTGRARGPWLLVIGVAVIAAVAILALRQRSSLPGEHLERQLAAARPLTADPALELGPRFSPDGRRVAYAVGAGRESRLVVQEVEGGQRLEIGAPGELLLSPVFFPDGERIAFWRRNTAGCEIVEMRLANRHSRRLLGCERAPRPRFDLSRDGKRIAFTGDVRAQFPAGLWLLDVANGQAAVLTTPEPGSGDDLFPRFSPDGRELAFFRGSTSHRRAWILEVEKPAQARAMSGHEGLSYGLAWLGPKGPLLVAADWLGFRALNVLDPASGEARLAGARGARFPDVGPAGDIVYENAIYRSDLWAIDGEGATPRPLWHSTRYTSQPDFSPDGRSVAFASNREGGDAIYVAALDGAPRRLAADESHRYLRPRWAADGRSVLAVRVLRASGRTVQQAVRLPADGGPAQPIPELGDAVSDVRETRDGRTLVWGEISGQAMRLLRAPIGRLRDAQRLPFPLVAHYQLNATHLVFMQPQLERLTRCRLKDLACEPMELALPESDLFHWYLTDRSIYRRVAEKGSMRLERRAFEGGLVTGTWAVEPGGAGSSIAASADDSRVVFAREEGPAVDLMLARP